MAETTTTTKSTNQVAVPYKSAIVKICDAIVPMVVNQLKGYNINVSEKERDKLVIGVTQIYESASKQGIGFNELDQSNVRAALQKLITLKLNPISVPNECYFQIYNEKDSTGKWVKKVKLEPQGAGYDSLLVNFGRDLKRVLYTFVIHEGDDYTLPWFDGQKMVDMTWKPKSYHGKVKMVVYKIERTDGITDYLVAEREGLVANLKAHIINNVRQVPDDKKNKILEKIEKMDDFEKMIDDPDLRGKLIYMDKSYNATTRSYEEKEKSVQLISPAWYQSSSREAMIERKLKNNATKKYPKDFGGNDIIKKDFEDTYDDYEQYRNKDAQENPIDVVDAEYSEKAQSKSVETPILEDKVNPQESAEKFKDEPKNNESEHKEEKHNVTNDAAEDDLPF